MSEKFDIMEQRDEEQILAEAKGHVIKEMFYKFPLDGKTVVGISWVGTKEIARRYGGIKMGIPVVTHLGDQYACSVQATETKNDLTLVGSSLQPKNMRKRDGSEVPDRFAYTKVTSKAQRNAIRALIPESFLLEMEKSFSAGKKSNKQVATDFKETIEKNQSTLHEASVANAKADLTEAGFEFDRCFKIWRDGPNKMVLLKIEVSLNDSQYAVFNTVMEKYGGRWVKKEKTWVIDQ